MKQPFLSILFVLVLCSGLQAAKPNLIIILTDDQGYADVGFNGCKDIPTPHLDSIAQNGVRFTNGYVSYPVCGPSRAGLLTGRYQDRFGFTTNPTIDPRVPHAGIPKDEHNIAEVLRPAGYKSAIIGKWHMGAHPSNHPLERGFDHFFGFLSGGHDYLPERLTLNGLEDVKKKWDWYRTRLIRDRERVDIDQYLTDELSEAAVAFVQQQAQAKQPFFLYLAYNAPHGPLQATEKYLQRFAHIENKKRRTYAAMVSAVDDGVGQLLATLREQGIEEETIVFFLSDNGGAEGKGSNNKPLRGFKSHLFEGGIHVPFAMQWKGQVAGGRDYTHPVISLDILATIVGQSGVAIRSDYPLDGVDLIPFLNGQQTGKPHETLFWRKWDNGGAAIRDGAFKLTTNDKRETDNYKLFNLEKDLSEKNNLLKFPKRAGQKQALLEKWEAWNSQMKDRIFPTLGDDQWWTR